MSAFHELTEGREVEVECNRCGYTSLLFLPDGVDLPPCRAPHPHSTQANIAECGGTSFDVKLLGAHLACGRTAMARELIDPGDGENRAVRSFLLLYGGACGVTVAQIRDHMRRSGYPLWPDWVEPKGSMHLTKLGAQNWLRHLFALEAADGVNSTRGGDPK